MSSEIDKAIELIEDKIAALQNVRDTLVEMFDAPDSLRKRMLAARETPAPLPTAAPLEPSELPALPSVNLLGSGNGNGKSTRKDEVAKFIREHGGSAKRSTIISGTGIPKGTVAYVLNDKDRFVGHRGLWRNVGEQ
jgi:hypothetical protein